MFVLLAKSTNVGRVPKTLVAHTNDVLRAVEALFGVPGNPTRLGRSWLQFFGLSAGDIKSFDRFLRHLRVTAAAHDWGKANDGFQRAVRSDGSQVVRHEHLSGLILSDETIREWLRSAGLDDIVVLSAVISHHVKAAESGENSLGEPIQSANNVIRICSGHEDFTTVWKMIQDEVGTPCTTPITFPTRWKVDEELESKSQAFRDVLDHEKTRLRDDKERRRWIMAVRAGLIVADAVGSAVVRMPGSQERTEDFTIDRWVKNCFPEPLTGGEVWEHIVKKRINDLRRRKKWDDAKGCAFEGEGGFSEFQRDVASKGHRVLLTAPCGSGKTLAAWNWIKVRLDARPASRVLFLYPTRATATEGFRDYVSWAPGDEAGLLTGTADYDLQGMFTTPDDVRHDRDYRSDPRLYALGHWTKRVFSATADQFFPFLQYGYGPLCLLPLLAEAIVVVDEVHSFDRSMFATLKRFLKEFPEVPVLCMTATLPKERTRDLTEDCRLVSYPDTPPADLVEISSHPRYFIQWIDRVGAKYLAVGALIDRKRVLWVSNRVNDSQTAFAALRDQVMGTATYCYHSRFKLEDRRSRHNDLVRGFQEAADDRTPPEGVLGTTTQVCEMSLDLDAEILVTELAPIASLIQRMGRCNRDSERMKKRPVGLVYVLRPVPGKEKPYERADLSAATRFVDKVADREVSQDELERVYRECDVQEVEPDRLCPFLDSGPYAAATREESFRDVDEFTVPCVLDDDLPKVLKWIADRKPIDGFILPVPKRFADAPRPSESRFPPWLSVARANRYDTLTGFHDLPRDDNEGGPLR